MRPACPFRPHRIPIAWAWAWLLAWALWAGAAQAQAPAAYPGILQLAVDATDLDHRLFQVRQRLPVVPGPLTLYFPRWLPGQHAPDGDVSRLAGLVMQAGGQALPWARDPADTHAFLVTVPPGVRELDLRFDHLSPVSPDSGRVVVTRQMLNLQWQSLLLYPAGPPASGITVQASLRLPEGWSYGTALRAERSDGATLRFAGAERRTRWHRPGAPPEQRERRQPEVLRGLGQGRGRPRAAAARIRSLVERQVPPAGGLEHPPLQRADGPGTAVALRGPD